MNRNHAADGGFNKAYLFVKQLFFVVVQELADFFLEIFVGTDEVFADYDVERSLIGVLPALSESSCNVAEDKFKNVNANGGGHDVGLGNGVGNCLGVLAVHTGDVFDH